MGQAKRRGTFEQRQMMAHARNLGLMKDFVEMPKGPLHEALKKHGVQRVATVLTAVGVLKAPQHFTSREVKQTENNNER